ncbi:MAG: catechol 2,3-dioxygenase-like lactoylglutathione lyase family enzyme [Parvicellaceae bacterium]|jgi:catechol 2,3-dioxygenase-like lactoylglutathione lyase family enzyme
MIIQYVCDVIIKTKDMRTKIYMEHANISVTNLNKAVEFFQTAFPTFKVRGGGEGWLHLGDEETYLALSEGNKGKTEHPDYEELGINHLGFVVEDVDSIAKRMDAHGFKRSYPKQIQKYRIRDYFNDGDDNQYEFVQYLSDKDEERNSYND